jgi:hypothetical protein
MIVKRKSERFLDVHDGDVFSFVSGQLAGKLLIQGTTAESEDDDECYLMEVETGTIYKYNELEDYDCSSLVIVYIDSYLTVDR